MDATQIKAELWDLQPHNCNGKFTMRGDGKQDRYDRRCSSCIRIMELQHMLRELEAEPKGEPMSSPQEQTTYLNEELGLLKAEVEWLQLERTDTRNAIKLIIGRQCDIPWPEVPEADVEGYLDHARAAEQIANPKEEPMEKGRDDPFVAAARCQARQRRDKESEGKEEPMTSPQEQVMCLNEKIAELKTDVERLRADTEWLKDRHNNQVLEAEIARMQPVYDAAAELKGQVIDSLDTHWAAGRVAVRRDVFAAILAASETALKAQKTKG